MLGVELEEAPSPISAPLSGGQNSVESSSNSQNNSIDEEVYQKQYEKFKKFYQKYHKKEKVKPKKVNIGYIHYLNFSFIMSKNNFEFLKFSFFIKSFVKLSFSSKSRP